MQIAPVKYYDQSKWSDVFTLTQMALETYFGNNVFRSNASRVIYASTDFAFRQRLNLLSKNNTSSLLELDLPFMRYFRTGNFQLDKERPAVQNASAGLLGFPESAIGFQNMRFLQMIINFNCTAYFTRNDDAQLAYETLQWISNPAPQQFAYGSLQYKGYAIDVPMLFEVADIQWMPNYAESEWLTKAHIIPIDFNVQWRTAILGQSPQTKESSTFWEDNPPVITKNVFMDFLSYKFQNTYYDQSNYALEVSGVFNSDPELLGVVSTSNITLDSLYVNWAYNPLANTYYTDTVIVNVNGVENFTVPMLQGSYQLTGLYPNSLYNITVWFTSLTGMVTKYTTSVTTTADLTIPVVTGIVGY